MGWIIEHESDRTLCWSNSDGWVSETYDTFTDEERFTLNLPINGKWVYVVWSAN